MNDAFSKCHPAVNFLFFVGAIGMSVLIQHPVYLLAGIITGAIYYLLLNGQKGIKTILGMALIGIINQLTAGMEFTLFGLKLQNSNIAVSILVVLFLIGYSLFCKADRLNKARNQ